MLTRPMKAEDLPDDCLDKLVFPVIGSPKLDGIRALKVRGRLLSSTFKPIPNEYIRHTLEKDLPDGVDGEIVAGEVFQDVTSAVMSRGGNPDFRFWIFDLVDESRLEEAYLTRLVRLEAWRWACMKTGTMPPKAAIVPTQIIMSLEELEAYEAAMLARGYEGVMLRSPDGPYKCGRATLKQQWLLKRKPFVDSEARIIGFEERLSNQNELETNELGLAKRSSAKAGKVPLNTLGKFLAEDIHGRFPGVTLKIGTGRGLTDELRQQVWDNRVAYQGQLVKYKFQLRGTKDAPRLPIFLGFRHPEDVTA